jgi:hypothetical protein
LAAGDDEGGEFFGGQFASEHGSAVVCRGKHVVEFDVADEGLREE